KGAPAELWGVWPGVQPHRLRLLDLPFSCVEWAQTPLPYHTEPGYVVQPDDVTAWDLSKEPPPPPHSHSHSHPPPPAAPSIAFAVSSLLSSTSSAAAGIPIMDHDLRGFRSGSHDGDSGNEGGGRASGGGAGDAPYGTGLYGNSLSRGSGGGGGGGDAAVTTATDGGQLLSPMPSPMPAATAAAAAAVPSEAHLVFTLTDGRAGVLSVRGRRIADTRVKRPMAGLLNPLELTATAMAAVGRTAVMGDSEGRLAVWEWGTGRTTIMATGLGLVRKIQIQMCQPPASQPPVYIHRTTTTTAPVSTAATTSTSAVHSPFSTTSVPATGGGGGGGASGGVYVKARVAALFASGQCCIFDLDSTNKLRPTDVGAGAMQRSGVRAVLDLA
ncbi:hypothetical protein Agub_g14898, partial [Astrephomene gubernaculifera]